MGSRYGFYSKDFVSERGTESYNNFNSISLNNPQANKRSTQNFEQKKETWIPTSKIERKYEDYSSKNIDNLTSSKKYEDLKKYDNPASSNSKYYDNVNSSRKYDKL